MTPLLRLLGILRLFAGEVVLSIFLGIAAIAAGIGLLGTSAHIIASAALHPSIATLQVAIVGVRFFGISRGVFRYLERLVSHSVNLKMVTRLREDFYLRIEPGAPANLVTLRGGDVLQRVMGDLEVLENFYVRVLSPMVIALVIVIGTSLFIGTYAVELGFLLFTGMVITGFIQPLIALLLTRKTSESLVRLNAESSAKWVEMLQGLEDIQACNAQRYAYAPLMEDIALAGKLQKRLSVLNGLNSGLGLLLMNLTLLAVLWVAIPIVNTGGFSGVSLAVTTLITLASFEAVNPLPAAAHQLSASIVAARRLFSPVGDEQNQLVRVDSELTSVQGIKLEGISLSYPGSGEKVLDGVEFKLKKGQKIALLGTSGAGKTSLINILVGFQHAQTGTFTVDGVDVKDVDPDAVRSLFAVLPQNIYLFNGDIRENMLLANPGSTDEDLTLAIERAGLSEWFLSQPDGLETWIGERGVKMSGGEKQRLAAARVLLQDRPFLLLDEPTANLDQRSADYVMRSLFQYAEQRGVLLITHDIAWLDDMDEIILLENGRIVERGRLSDLLHGNGLFPRLFKVEMDRLVER